MLKACANWERVFVAFSPVADSCNALHDERTLNAKDIRKAMPRFSPENYANLRLLPPYLELAQEAGCAPSWRWLGCCMGNDIIPIPGTTSVEHLRENLGAADVKLDAGLLARLDALVNESTVTGNRYSEQSRGEVDTEEF